MEADMEQQDLDVKCMEIAYKEAQKAVLIDEVPVGAVLVDENNNIIAKGHNLKEKNQSSIAHAEIVVINKANKKLNTWHLENTTLYVTLEPCLMCCGAIIQARIKRVVFGAYDNKGGMVVTNLQAFELPSLNHHVLYTGGVKIEKCSLILSNYFKNKRK
jgi:tRNA(adenine34) deaminase